jgi:hypothetical protein
MVAPRSVVSYEGAGLYQTFEAKLTGPRVGRATGYDNAHDAVASMVMITKGPKMPAVAVMREGDRFVGRGLTVDWKHDDNLEEHHGPWQLEQHPEDNQWNGDFHPDGDTIVDPDLVAIVDGRSVLSSSQLTLPPD